MTQRDWQKDMEMFEEANKAALTWLVGKGAAEAGVYWLQAYAAEANEVCYWKGEAEAEKARADAAEDRVRRLKEEIEYEIELLTLRGSDGRAEELRDLLSTLYPDTPAPKEADNEN